jgi:hypothetical protein
MSATMEPPLIEKGSDMIDGGSVNFKVQVNARASNLDPNRHKDTNLCHTDSQKFYEQSFLFQANEIPHIDTNPAPAIKPPKRDRLFHFVDPSNISQL